MTFCSLWWILIVSLGVNPRVADPWFGPWPLWFFFSFRLLQLASWNGFWSTDYLCAAFTWQLVRMEEAIKETLQNKHYFLSWVFFFLAAEPAAAVQTGWWMQTIWNNSFSLGSINTTFSLLMCVCVCHNTHTRGGGDFYFTALETDSYYRFNDFTFQSVPLDFSAVNVVKKKLNVEIDGHSDIKKTSCKSLFTWFLHWLLSRTRTLRVLPPQAEQNSILRTSEPLTHACSLVNRCGTCQAEKLIYDARQKF